MAKVNVEKIGVNTFYAVDIDDRSYTVEEMYDVNSDSNTFEVMRVDDNREYVVTDKEREEVLEAVACFIVKDK